MSDENVNEQINKKLRSMELEKRLTESCDGINCVKKDMLKMKDDNESLKNIVNEIKDNSDRMIEFNDNKTVKCKCNNDIVIGSSFCPNCGSSIHKWNGLPEWKSYNERKKR